MQKILLLLLLGSILFINPRVQAQQPDPLEELQRELQRNQMELLKQFQQLQKGGLPGGFGLPFGGPMFPGGAVRPARLGVKLERPTVALRDQLDIPENQGLVVTEVIDGSVAAKAGIRPSDILLEFHGNLVPGDPETFVKSLQAIKADVAGSAILLRKGRKETIKDIKLPEVKPEVAQNPFANFPNFPGFGGLNLPGLGGPGAIDADMTSMQVVDGKITMTNVRKGVKTVIRGEKNGADFVPSEIIITDAGVVSRTDRVEKVPEQYRDGVKKLLETIR